MSEYIVKIEEPISPLFYERQLEGILRCKDCCLQDGEPITHIVINKDGVAIATDEDCEPIFFDMKETAVKMSLALTWAVGDWDFGWERIYV